MEPSLGPKTGFYRSTAREAWQPQHRHPEVWQGVSVLLVSLFTIAAGGALVFQTGEAFAEVLFGIACLGWSINRLWERRDAFRAWRRIGNCDLEAASIDLRQGEAWDGAIALTPRRDLVVTHCTLTAWSKDSRQRGGASSAMAWAYDVPIPVAACARGVTVRWPTSITIPDPPDALPSRFGGDWTRQWTVTAELVTDTGERWRREYPVLVFPSSASAVASYARGGAGEGEPGDEAESAAGLTNMPPHEPP
ncbi:MAG: hypothetical protein MUF00_04735 [Gemmatimonadaceae bacterium]|jgi:hypothetical protein|nr:hypothetical protein [Gemmatimonadaceae bacterium]